MVGGGGRRDARREGEEGAPGVDAAKEGSSADDITCDDSAVRYACFSPQVFRAVLLVVV